MAPLLRRTFMGSLAAGALATAGCASAPIKIGFVGGLTGRTADLGVAGRDGALLALEQANAAGGVNGRLLELVTADDQQQAEAAVSAFQQLQRAGVALVLGPMTSAMAMHMVPLANASGLLLLSPTVTTSALTGLDDQFFRVISSTREYAITSARYHAQRGKLTRIAAILDLSNAAYTERWLADFDTEFQRYGGQIVARVGYQFQPGLAFGDIARQALQQQPEGLLLLTGAVDAAQLLQQLRKLRPTLPLMTAEWAATEQLIALAGAAAEGVMAAQFLDRLNQMPAYLAFQRDHQQRFGRPAGFAELAGFDAMGVALQALAAQGRGESLKQTLLRLRRFKGAQHEVEFTPQGDAVRQTYLTRVHQGRYEVLG